MKANELRIGNLIKCKFKLASDYEDIRCNKDIIFHFDIYDLKPIPLTAEWLIKFGFKKRLDEKMICDLHHIGMNPITHDYLFFTHNHLFCLKRICSEKYPFFLFGYHKIKYVHQLQNLYFALLNKELTLI